MNYFFIALITTLGAAFIIYFLLNKFLHTKIQVIPLMLCAACSLFLSMALPKFVVRYTDWIGTLAVLALFSVLFAYFLAYYDEKIAEKQIEVEDSGQCLFHAAQSSDAMPNEIATALLPIKPINLNQTDKPDNSMFSSIDPLPIGVETIDEELNRTLVPLQPIELNSTSDDTDNNANNGLPDPLASSQFDIPSEIPCINPSPIAADEPADEMLNRAFKLKELRDYNAAAQLFRNILQLNKESSAAPLLLLEIADALRHTGEIQAAKNVLVDGLSYSVVTGTLSEQKIRAMIDSLEQC